VPAKLSVIVPAYNEESTLGRCVQRVIEIGDENARSEIIIVDDCSTDRTLDIAARPGGGISAGPCSSSTEE